MYTESYLRYLLSDDSSLQRYYVGREPVSLGDIKRSLMLIERENNRHIPDHYYRLGQRKSFGEMKYLSDLFTIGLKDLANEYLEMRNGIIYVKADKMNSWQMLLPYMPPLLLDCVILWQHEPIVEGNEFEYVEKYLKSNISFTAYPSPYIPQLRDFLEKGGLSDLHMHLNGALETDLAWQDFLQNPLKIKYELDAAFGNEKVKEQYEQSSFLSTPDKFYELLRVASVLRMLIYSYVYGKETYEEENIKGSYGGLLHKIADKELFGGYCAKHPMEQYQGVNGELHYLEALLYIKVLQEMSLRPENDVLSGLFHYYLLILGLTNKMMVQQPSSYGFEEFQKITLNGLREYSEKIDYSQRFLQMSGNQLKNIRLLEGRFSPKDRLQKNEEMVDNIRSGWKTLCSLQGLPGKEQPSLRLIAHFIKKEDKGRNDTVRHKDLREDIDHRADILIYQLRNDKTFSEAVFGIDAASSEFDAPPEVFAPVYRRLRKSGFHHFTYHAGEDFFHILSGLRAIYEAITYLDLQRCDRIGHATAAGVPVGLWHRNIGDKMLIKQGEYLDNLIFAYHLISKSDDERLKALLPQLSLKIDEYAYDVYQNYYPVSIHIKAWKRRYTDPKEAIEEMVRKCKEDDVRNLFIDYHRKETRKRYDKIIEIDTLGDFDEEQLTALQLLLLKYMHQKEIVIETLPTSNVIIGNHHDYSTYHLYNWYMWKKEGMPLPPIVVGTDDVGIFATNIYNEYCNIYCQFLYTKKMNSDEIVNFLKELNANARHYAFVD